MRKYAAIIMTAAITVTAINPRPSRTAPSYFLKK